MPNRLLALVGLGKGPKLHTADMTKPRLEIRGFKSDHVVCVETESTQYRFLTQGPHELGVSRWMRVIAEGESKNLVCSISSE